VAKMLSEARVIMHIITRRPLHNIAASSGHLFLSLQQISFTKYG